MNPTYRLLIERPVALFSIPSKSVVVLEAVVQMEAVGLFLISSQRVDLSDLEAIGQLEEIR